MKGNVFIAWGGNKELADQVAVRIRRHGFVVQVGGDTQQSFFVGKQIIEQMQKAQLAVILAQDTRSNREGDQGLFRPNLLFEWGYLVAKLAPQDVHVFLIGVSPKSLPSDLQGCWCIEVPELADLNQLADLIATGFLGKAQAVQIDPEQVFVHWHEWKVRVQKQITTGDAIDETALAVALLHSIQPGYYSGELTWLKQAIAQLRSTTRDVAEVKALVSSISDFYLVTENQLKRSSLGDLKSIRDELRAETRIENPDLRSWAELLRIDFLGLCHMFMADSPELREDQDEYLNAALSYFERALAQLAEIREKAPGSGYCDLWEGYITRNAAVMSSRLGRQQAAVDLFNTAFHARVRALKHFKAQKTPELLVTHLELEACLVTAEMLRYGHTESRTEFRETLSAMRRLNKQFALWKLVMRELESVAARFGVRDLIDEIHRSSP